MNTQADKMQENRSRSATDTIAKKQDYVESTFKPIDSRPEVIAQRKLQELANNSPRVRQLRVLQEVADNSSHAKTTARLQAMVNNYTTQQQQSIQQKKNSTGLPNNLKSGIENLSGYSMDDVKVHYNSGEPAQLQAHAYTQGTDIHIAAGQEKHLPHEAWHVVQQKQGRVKPTMQMQGKVNVNDDTNLEREADIMGSKSISLQHSSSIGFTRGIETESKEQPIQAVWIEEGPSSFVWHATRDGVEWHYNEEDDTMFYVIRKFPKDLSKKAKDFYIKFNERPLPYEKWIQIMSSELGELEDKDDPVYEDPEFLVGEGSQDKITTLQVISKVLRSAGIRVFLGGAASGALITQTRKIKDLDLRMDGQERDIFNENKYPNFFRDRIEIPLTEAGFKISGTEKAANTTMRFDINGIDVSITSEPSNERTMTRGEMVTDIESLGEIDFILDKAAAAADRKDINKMVTDIFDIIRVSGSMPGGGGVILSSLASMRPKSKKGIKNLITKLRQISATATGRVYKDKDIGIACEGLCNLLGIDKADKANLATYLMPIINGLETQVETEVI